ncbi:MAG TPA: hypothetical protein VN577_10460 [Terriglobales bacterium]|nr:hypothetical protein [Terriglobales bacterium]
MRLNINLASQPYEDARRFTALWTGILGALVLLAVILGAAAIHHWQSYRQMTNNINREKQILADYDVKQQQDLEILNRPQNRDVRQKSEFLNELIRRKELSWTQIFNDLEKMMPPRLRVLAVEPQVRDDQIVLKMELGGDSRERAAELVRRMERSRTFRYAQVVSEADAATTPGESDVMRFQITAEYVPANERPAQAPAGTTGGGQ